MFKNILMATDMLKTCYPAMLTAIEIVKKSNGNLTILHVRESRPNAHANIQNRFGTDKGSIFSDGHEKKFKQKIFKAISGALEPRVNYEIKVASGIPWNEIIKRARAQKVDLIILGPHAERLEEKETAAHSGPIGSTIEGVVMHERCPVMIVNRIVAKESMKFKKVMVSIDFSKSCTSALRFAIEFSRKHTSKLFLFHMLPVPPFPEYSQANYEAELLAANKKLQALCKEIPAGIEYEHKSWGGALPYLEIGKYADRKDIDLIVMGSHTKEKQGKWYVGSAVERVSIRSACPVIVVTDHAAPLSTDG